MVQPAAPIRTPRGWLAIDHGADARSRYCLGALLLDGDRVTVSYGASDSVIGGAEFSIPALLERMVAGVRVP
ncbi:MAG: hypothetical protein K8T26_14040 [Lentisphaerae bacterium]|nr:hypothetical protein [Lentisphaerota bacterium]